MDWKYHCWAGKYSLGHMLSVCGHKGPHGLQCKVIWAIFESLENRTFISSSASLWEFTCFHFYSIQNDLYLELKAQVSSLEL